MEQKSNPYLHENEARQLASLQKQILKDYSVSSGTMTTEEWLPSMLRKHLPDHTDAQIAEIANELIETAQIQEKMRVSQSKAIQEGRSQESWFASTVQQATSHMTAQEATQYLNGLDEAVKTANEQMRDTLLTQAGIVNQNHNLDGFIAEQHHVNSYNLKAQATGSDYRAEVVKPEPGTRYGKDSIDVIVKDGSGNTVARYQVKYGATAEDTIQYIKRGNYEGQDLIVPADQVEAVQKAFPDKKVTAAIEDGKSSSKPLTKEEAQKMRDEAQKKGNFLEQDWSAYSNKDIALGIGKQVGIGTLQGAAVGVGFQIAEKIWNDEPLEGEEVLKTAITTGADSGVKIATASALKVASEKGIIALLPKGTSTNTFTAIATVAIENIKVAAKVVSGELTPREGLLAMEQTTGACVAGIVTAGKGAVCGATIGAVLGPIGSAIGGFVGGITGYMAGSTLGKAVIKGAQKIRDVAVKTIRNIGTAVKEGFRTAKNGLKALLGF